MLEPSQWLSEMLKESFDVSVVAARLFNQREGNDVLAVYSCVTKGESWQFLRLVTQLEIGQRRYFLSNLPQSLGVLHRVIQ